MPPTAFPPTPASSPEPHRVRRARGAQGAHPLSVATRKRLLSGLLVRADAGCVASAEALVRLGMQRKAILAATLGSPDGAGG